jgi:hypothetical protein
MSIFQPALFQPSLGGMRLIRLALVLPLLLAIPPGRAQMEPQIGQAPPRGGSADKKPPRTLKLSPKMRVTPLEAPDPVIPIGAIRPFLEHAYVLDAREIEQAPYVVAFPDRRVLGETGNKVYVRGLDAGVQGRYRLVRPGGPFLSPTSGEVLGYQAQQVAEATLERPGDPAVLRIDSMSQEIATGDRLVATRGNEPLPTFRPRPGPRGQQAQILAVLNGVSQIGSLNVVVIDLGTDQGVEPGHLFDIYNGGEQIKDRCAPRPPTGIGRTRSSGRRTSGTGISAPTAGLGMNPIPTRRSPCIGAPAPWARIFSCPWKRPAPSWSFAPFRA